MRTVIDPVIEREAFDKGAELIAGVDECGVGTNAGPVVACCAMFGVQILRADYAVDCKTVRKRSDLIDRSRRLRRLSQGYAIAWVLPSDIEHLDRACRYVLYQAVSKLGRRFGWPWGGLFVDHHEIDVPCNHRTIPVTVMDKADQKIRVVAAASIIAKSFRDRFMSRLAKQYPGYGWETNTGHFTRENREATVRLGLTPWHRLNVNYERIAQCLKS